MAKSTTESTASSATTTAASTSCFSSSSSLRYTRLVSVLEKTLKQSRKHFDIKQAVAEVYGDDANIFGCSSSSSSSSSKSRSKNSKDNDDEDQTTSDNNMLRQVFESMLDRIEEEVSHDMLNDYFVKIDVKEKFLKLEAIIEMLRLQDIHRQEMEEADKQSARLAAEAVKRPKMYHHHHDSAATVATTAEIIHMSTLQEMKAQRDALLRKVESVEAENCTLQNEMKQRMQAHKAKGAAPHVMQQLAMELENAADVGSQFDK